MDGPAVKGKPGAGWEVFPERELVLAPRFLGLMDFFLSFFQL